MKLAAVLRVCYNFDLAGISQQDLKKTHTSDEKLEMYLNAVNIGEVFGILNQGYPNPNNQKAIQFIKNALQTMTEDEHKLLLFNIPKGPPFAYERSMTSTELIYLITFILSPKEAEDQSMIDALLARVFFTYNVESNQVLI